MGDPGTGCCGSAAVLLKPRCPAISPGAAPVWRMLKGGSWLHSHSTVGSVSPPPGLRGLVDDNVLDDQLLDGELLGVRVRLGVLKETEEEVDRLDGPSTWG